MRQLFPESEIFKIARRDQQVVNDEHYQLSMYCLRVPCSDGELIYHNMTGELMLLSFSEIEAVDQYLDTYETSDFATIEQMIRCWYLIPIGYDERKLADQIRHLSKLVHPVKPGINSYTIFTTTDCDARCYYCYEKGRPRISMSDQTAHDVAGFICRKSEGRDVKFWWFGGEPLYNVAAIDTITTDLTKAGVRFRSRMVSNGYLFDEDMVSRAVEMWRLDYIQIPLDGREEVYNRNKAFIYRDGSAYRRVIDNIGLLLDAGIRVSARLNVDRKNAEEMSLLADELIARFAGRGHFEAYAALLRDFGHRINLFSSDDEALAVYEALQNKLIAGGIGRVEYLQSTVSTNMCMADNDRSLTILPDGKIGKCEHLVDTATIGSIYEDGLDTETVGKWKEQIRIPECSECFHYPFCIRLKNCPWNYGVCAPYNRKIMTINLRQIVLNVYNKAKGGLINE